MSRLGDELRRQSEGLRAKTGPERDLAQAMAVGLIDAAAQADEHEAAALADSAQGRGPHAALVLLWAAERYEAVGSGRARLRAAQLRLWANEAERPPAPTGDGPDDDPPVRVER